MTSIKTKSQIVIWGCAILLYSCTILSDQKSIHPIQDKVWILQSIETVTKMPPTKVSFTLISSTKKLTANSLCNTINGSFVINEKSKNLRFSTLSTTYKACGNLKAEKAFFGVFQKTSSYKIKKGILYLQSSDKILASFK